jgi:hypothetical protein
LWAASFRKSFSQNERANAGACSADNYDFDFIACRYGQGGFLRPNLNCFLFRASFPAPFS